LSGGGVKGRDLCKKNLIGRKRVAERGEPKGVTSNNTPIGGKKSFEKDSIFRHEVRGGKGGRKKKIFDKKRGTKIGRAARES